MRRGPIRRWCKAALLAALLPAAAGATTVQDLLDAPVTTVGGQPAGRVEELIVDVLGGRVVYVVIDRKERFMTLPVGALSAAAGAGAPRVDLSLSNAMAAFREEADPRFRRARTLIGQPLHHPGGSRIGSIADIEFEPGSGRIGQVLVATGEGRAAFPPGVLAHGRFPPLTRWQVEYPTPAPPLDGDALMRPSDERTRVHDHRWEGQWGSR